MSRLPAVSELLGGLMEVNPLLVSIASCQVISNVPSAILLSRFTDIWEPLLLGVNIGGTGTLISSLASLITFAEYRRHGGSVKHYLKLFTLFNILFLVVLTALALVQLQIMGI